MPPAFSKDVKQYVIEIPGAGFVRDELSVRTNDFTARVVFAKRFPSATYAMNWLGREDSKNSTCYTQAAYICELYIPEAPPNLLEENLMRIQIARAIMVLSCAYLAYWAVAYHPRAIFPGIMVVVISMAVVDMIHDWQDKR